MPTREPDRVQREIEELLDRLDNFIPEERLVAKIRSRRRQEAGPNALERAWATIKGWLGRISVGHVMLAGLALMLVASFAPGLFAGYARFAVYLGLALSVGGFVLAVVNRDARRTLSGAGRYEKRWRGQVIEYGPPSPASRLRSWWRNRWRR
jgi:hypothetical protein